MLLHVIRGPLWRGMHGDYHRWGGEPIGWRSTLNSFRQNIKVLQQLLGVPRLKPEQSQAHRELLLLPGKWILLRVPRVNHAFSLRCSQSDSNYFITLHQEGRFLCSSALAVTIIGGGGRGLSVFTFLIWSWCCLQCRSSIHREAFWKVSPLCVGACLTFRQTWSIRDRVDGALACMSALQS